MARYKVQGGGYLKGPGGGRARRPVSSGGGGTGGVRTLLTTSDLSYLGNFRWPNNSDTVTSWANFTGKRIGSTIRFYGLCKRTASEATHEKLISFDYPGTSALTPYGASMPIAPLVKDFGPIWDGRRPTNETDYPRTHGLRWIDGRLWWIYGTSYEGTSHNPALACSVLDESAGTMTAAYGPWRPSVHTGKFTNALVEVPAWFQSAYGCGSHMQIGGMRVANGSAPWGMANHIFTPPPISTPPDTIESVDGGHQSFTVTTVSDSGISYPMPRESDYLTCYWVDQLPPYPFGYPPAYNCANGSGTNPSTQSWGGGGMALDWVDHGEWVDTGTKHGIVMFGQWVDTIPGYPYPSDGKCHSWYGPNTCCHGHFADAHEATGPGATTLVSMVFIQDPADIAEVFTIGRNPTTVVPVESVQWGTLPDNEHGSYRSGLYQFGAVWFDATDNLLFVSHRWAYDFQPIMHVYQVS